MIIGNLQVYIMILEKPVCEKGKSRVGTDAKAGG